MRINLKSQISNLKSGFTLIELLVVISIIGILVALSIFGLQGARQSGRDATRKADLEEIRSGLEIYKADCNAYPPTNKVVGGSSLVGAGTSTACALANTYIAKVPADPESPTRSYAFTSAGTSYIICAALEVPPSPALDVSGCGSCGEDCNYKVTNP